MSRQRSYGIMKEYYELLEEDIELHGAVHARVIVNPVMVTRHL